MGKFVLKIKGESEKGFNLEIDGVHRDLVNAMVSAMLTSDEVRQTVEHSVRVYEAVKQANDTKTDVSTNLE